MQSARERADVRQSPLELLRGGVEQLGSGLVAALARVLARAREHLRERVEPPLGAVVEPLLQACALVVGGVQQPPPRLAQLVELSRHVERAGAR